MCQCGVDNYHGEAGSEATGEQSSITKHKEIAERMPKELDIFDRVTICQSKLKCWVNSLCAVSSIDLILLR